MSTLFSESLRSTDDQHIVHWLDKFSTALTAEDFEEATSLFVDECYWRDLAAFTWNIVTAEGRPAIREQLASTLANTSPDNWMLADHATSADGIVEGWFTFETEVARCRGHVRLRDGKCWTLFTVLDELKGQEEKKGHRRVLGTHHKANPGRTTWLEDRERVAGALGYEEQPDCVILGGGQSGIMMAAHLRRLGVTALIIDRNERPGDAWRNRYKTLCLHDPVWYDHLPYFPFPDDWPVFTPKDKMADWLELYVKAMELNCWNNAECKSASFDPGSGSWTLEVSRDGVPVTLTPAHVVIAIGVHGFPSIPEFPGQDTFRGEQHHSSSHRSGPQYDGKKCIVVGGNNSAHDISLSLWENGADVTMIQRSPTTVVRSNTLMDITLGLYSEDAAAQGISTDMADAIAASVPYKILAQKHAEFSTQIKEVDADFYDRLSKAGFKADFGPDGSGLLMRALRDGGGYYIDVGASELVADGRIKVRGAGVDHLTADSVVLTDGTVLPADVIVYATGYKSLNEPLAGIFSQEVADQIGKVWGLGSGTAKDPGPWEGELRNQWKPMAVPNLWMTGGNLALARYYSRILALQIKARLEGLSTPVYAQAKVHHKG